MKPNHRFGQDFARMRSPGLWSPNGNTGGTNSSIGPPFTQDGTVTFPAPTNTLETFALRGSFANAGGVINQTVGLRIATAAFHPFLRGDTVHVGGFYCSMRFRLDAWPDNTTRLFAGISAATTNVAAADAGTNGTPGTLPLNTVGVMHDTGDLANELYFVQKGAAGNLSKTIITGGEGNPVLAAGRAFWLEIWCQTTNTIRVQLWDITANKSLMFGLSGLVAATTFTGPQCVMSNGSTAGNVVGLGCLGIHYHAGDNTDL